ncbi:MAG: hypothetical protein IPK71_13285 [Myxococcales bacterium]|nr:hypothetical protein [Myxococcales bacterium]
MGRVASVVVGAFGLASLLAGSASGCAVSEVRPEERSCAVTVWHKPASRAARVEIIGDFNGFQRPGVELDRASDEWRALTLELPPGEQRYLIVEDGVALTDRNVATTAFEGGREVTLVEVPSCGVPAFRVDGVKVDSRGSGAIEATFLAAKGGAELDPATAEAVTRDGRVVRGEVANATSGRIRFPLEGLPRGKTVLTLRARSRDGAEAEPALATAWVEGRPFDARDTVLYQVVVDRFRGDAGPLAPPATPSDRAGGTLRGVTRAIEDGTIAGLGANAIWISPVYTNPEGKFSGNDGRSYSSYHQYWPTDPRGVDARIGGEAALDELVRTAHARGIRVLFDVVPNHVHETHPYAKVPGFTQGSASCVCGQRDCDWATKIDTCWFAPYLPDLDWANPELARTATRDTVYWLDRFDADGFRIDAVPMTPRAATRRIAAATRRKYAHPGNPMLVIGENFTGPGAYNLLRRDLGPFGLDGTFHFPLMWTLRESIAEERTGLSAIDASMIESEKAWGGSGAVMGVMIGNHDVSRFSSVSAGTAGGDTWEPAKDAYTKPVFDKQRLGLAAVMTLPGMPVVYYGDEVALPGKSDPDCRRVMPREETLSAEQRELRSFVAKLGKVRGCSRALRRGTYTSKYADAERLVFTRELEGGKRAVVILARKPLGPLDLTLVNVPAGTYRDLVDAGSVTFGPEVKTMDLAPYSVRILTNDDDDCPPP